MNVNGILTNLDPPKIMGILNINHDSFFAESRLRTETEIVARAGEMIWAGADILDIGALSTRPGATLISETEEQELVFRAITAIRKQYPEILISVDTFRSGVAEAAIQAGAGIINDISGFQFDPAIVDVAARHHCPYILMHLQGTFETMHANYTYTDITQEVIRYFHEKIAYLVEKGLNDILIDPGFGFSKTTEQNFDLFAGLHDLHILERPILVGISRKSMIRNRLGVSTEDALNGTTVLNTLAVERGASILRVHDVKEAKEILILMGY